MLQRLDDSILEQVFAKLSPNALSAVEAVCRHWCTLVTRSQIWEQHASSNQGAPSANTTTSSSGSSRRPSTAQRPAPTFWRDACLHRAASAKWHAGRLSLAASLNGHTGPVTCMDVNEDWVLTGSSDGTARLWDLGRGVQLHVLQRPADTAPVVAVALVSVSMAVTATAKGGALLWRDGAVIRRFEVMPGGRVTALALTDTQLLLGSSAGTVQHFDLFSGRQQLITRHSSGVTHLLTHRRLQLAHHQPPQQLQLEEAEEWLTLVGCVDGQVSCVGSSTGRLLWQLPTRHPSKVVSMQLVDWQPALHSQGTQQGGQHFQQLPQHSLLLYVLNARSQLICWQLPKAALSPQSQDSFVAAAAAEAAAEAAADTPSKSARSSSQGGASMRAGAVRGTGSRQRSSQAAVQPMAQVAAVGQLRMPLWPLSVCSIAAPASSSHLYKQEAATPSLEQQQQQQQTNVSVRQAHLAAHNSSTCLLSPMFGRDCLLIGTTLGHLAVAALDEGGDAADAGESGSEQSATDSSRLPSSSARGEPSTESSRPVDVREELHPTAVVPLHQPPVGVAADSTPRALSTVSSDAVRSAAGVGQQQQQAARRRDSQQDRAGQAVQLQVVRHCSLHKLGKLLAGRQAATVTTRNVTRAAGGASTGGSTAVEPTKAAAEAGMEGAHCSAEPSGQEHVFSGSKVFCMKFAPNGLLVVGLGSGHVCCLKFKHPTSSPWT